MEMQADGNIQAQSDKATEKHWEADAAGQEKQAKAPVESACQLSSNCHLLVDGQGGGEEGC